MIGFLRGRLEARMPGSVLIDVGGVGYEAAVSAPTAAGLGAPGSEVRLRTRLIVREDALLLYGFADEAEMGLFDLLTSVAGVGPKIALAVLSVLPPKRLQRAVAEEDVAALTAVAGVGRKTAQRIVLELRDKLGAAVAEPVPGGPPALDDAASQAVAALVGLGFTLPEAHRAVAAIEAPTGDAAEMVRQALRAAGGKI